MRPVKMTAKLNFVRTNSHLGRTLSVDQPLFAALGYSSLAVVNNCKQRTETNGASTNNVCNVAQEFFSQEFFSLNLMLLKIDCLAGQIF